MREHGWADVWQLEEIILKVGLLLVDLHPILQVRCLAGAVIPKESLLAWTWHEALCGTGACCSLATETTRLPVYTG